MSTRAPLAGLRMVDSLAGGLGPATRYLAELGADVLHLAEGAPPAIDSREGLRSLAAHAGKRWLAVGADRAALTEALATADAVVFDSRGTLGRSIAKLATDIRKPCAVIACSDFGDDNPLSEWVATDPVLHALSGELSRSGIRGLAPLLPPGDLAFECAAAQLAYVSLVAMFRTLQSGRSERVDFSALDGAMQALDPGYGISGSATMGRPARLLSPARPQKGTQYPILPCADGHVRICLLAARQWRGMFEWMGRPEAFAAPEFERVQVRYASPDLLPAIGAFFAGQTRAELEAGAKRHGVPLSALLSPHEALAAEHFAERQTFALVDLGENQTVRLPNGVLEIDGERMNCGSAPTLPPAAPTAAAQPGLPLSGLKVVDLGVIVVGGEQSRLLADLGADVIKIESRGFPDGTRQTDLKIGMSPSFAAGHRNKRSLGLDLRAPEGQAVFARLVREADVVLTNFKPGTLESLGFGYEALRALNPAIILVESSAFGPSGPWAKRMGYGPLVRAATGLTEQWRYPDDPESFSDSVTIYPDHVGGRVTALGVLALLLDRARSGRGGRVTSAQAEIVLAHQGWRIAARELGLIDPDEPEDAPWGVYPAAGDDQWCVVTVRGDADWRELCGAIVGLDANLGRADRLARSDEIAAVLKAWLAERSADDAAQTLQSAGIPAAPMLRVAELPEYRYFSARGIFREEKHPWLAEPHYAEAMAARFSSIAPPPEEPAPLAGEHSVEVLRDWLGLDEAEIAALIEAGALQPLSGEMLAALDEIRRERALQETTPV